MVYKQKVRQSIMRQNIFKNGYLLLGIGYTLKCGLYTK